MCTTFRATCYLFWSSGTWGASSQVMKPLCLWLAVFICGRFFDFFDVFFHVCSCFFTLYLLICWSGSDWAAFNRCNLLEWRVLYGPTAHAKYGGNMESHGAPLSLIIGQPQPGAAGRAHCSGAQMSGECGTAMDSADWFVQLPWDDLFPTCQRVSRFYQRCICPPSPPPVSVRPQPRTPDLNGHCRTSTAGARCQIECHNVTTRWNVRQIQTAIE